MTKSEIILAVSSKTGQDKEKVSVIIEAFFGNVKDTLINGDELTIREFGVFRNKKNKARPVQNIRAKTTIMMPEHFVPTFVPSKNFYD